MAGVAGRATLLDTSARGVQPTGDRLGLLTAGNGLQELRFSAVSGLPDPDGVLPAGEHLSDVVRGATRSVPRQTQHPHRPQLLGSALVQP